MAVITGASVCLFRSRGKLGGVDPEGQFSCDVVEELDRGFLVVLVIDLQDPESGAVVDSGELVVAGLACSLTGRNELFSRTDDGSWVRA